MPQATIRDLHIGTGANIFKHISTDLKSVQRELIFVTCFWRRSESLDILNDVLTHLAQKGESQGHKIRVLIYVSSVSWLQKLFHRVTPGHKGHVYQDHELSQTFGLLPHDQWRNGLDLRVQSVFYLPYGVYHSKFMILDRQTVILPSCNVSWERWLEVMIKFDGPIVDSLCAMFSQTWLCPLNGVLPVDHVPEEQRSSGIAVMDAEDLLLLHHRNPRFKPFPCQTLPPPPSSPLNNRLIELFRTARKDLYIQTPNLTSPVVLDELRKTIRRGVNVHIVTCEKMMVLEQIVTAGTTTQRCVAEFLRRRRRELVDGARAATPFDQSLDTEAGLAGPSPGHLLLQYYEPASTHDPLPPDQSHIKLTIADGEHVVLGSGNMDRASWYTSNEVGVIFQSKELSQRLRDQWSLALQDNLRTVFNG